MRALLLATLLSALLPAAFAPSASAVPPVCVEKDAGVGSGVQVHVRVTCGPGASITVCPPPPSTLPCGRVAA